MNTDYIEIINARENNLKDVSLQIPKGKITIFTGVSGSGKSSIVFDTIAQEAGRQLNETYSSFTRLYLPRYQRPEVDEIHNLSTAIVVNQKRLGGNSRSTLGTVTDINTLLRLLFSRFSNPKLGYGNAFSFNDPSGMCPTCEGVGNIITMKEEEVLDKEKSLNEGAILLPGFTSDSYYLKTYTQSGFFDNDKKIKDYTEKEYQLLMYAESQKVLINHQMSKVNVTYEGLVTRFMRSYVNTEKEKSKTTTKRMLQYTTTCTCPTCKGKRYNEKVLAATIEGYSIYDVTAMQLDTLNAILAQIQIDEAKPIVDSIMQRVQNLCDIGLGYLTLTRETSSLSGGESQRVKMVKHLSSSLTGMLYIFDEPSIGLHPRDVYRLNGLLMKLRDKGNTVLVVEHDPDVIKIADYIVDVGPKAGTGGGNIMYTGDYKGLLNSNTITGEYLTKQSTIKENPRSSTTFIESKKSSLHNLKNISLRIPKGILTCVTGVAGSGKSTLVSKVFVKDYPESIFIDQSPVHTNSRSNPATFSGIMDAIRKTFSVTNNVKAGLFSYNSDGGCEHCGGTGIVELNLSFMDKMEIKCSECDGTRYKKEVLQYTYKQKNIVDIMDMTINEARTFFDAKDIVKKLDALVTVGLDYLTLGQPLNTLSGGECQRLKLAKELNTKGNIYILDEPTTGLHMSDISKIVEIMDALVERGNTIIVIEHNLDVIRRSDWIIDLGPNGGTEGGEIMYEGTPKGLLSSKESITAKYI
ncbi:MAG: ATP-binding cassette domain-containing protein [Coprobacillaceae bacterium]